MKVFWKILMRFFAQVTGLAGWIHYLMLATSLLLMAGFFIYLVYRFVRKQFQTYVLEIHTNWLMLSFPVLMIFLLFSYFGSSTTNTTLLVLLLLTAISIFLVLMRVLTSAAEISRLQDTEKAVQLQMQMQRQEYEDLCKKMELSRTYRHDMRHHLMVLEGLAVQGDTERVKQYIGNLNGQLTDVEKESYCENFTVNAVLASCIGRAKELHCTIAPHIALPKEIPFDEMDVCMVLANALENATNACQKICEDNRYIHLTAVLSECGKLTISVKNPCNDSLDFDGDGYPIIPKREGHGIGLKSIDAVTRKYNGMFRCECKEGKFRFCAVLFGQQPGTSKGGMIGKDNNLPKKLVSSALLLSLIFCLCVNCIPVMAQTFEDTPVLGTLVRLADLRSYRFHWGDTSFQADLPILATNGLSAGSQTASIAGKVPTRVASDQNATSSVPDKLIVSSIEITGANSSFSVPSDSIQEPQESARPNVSVGVHSSQPQTTESQARPPAPTESSEGHSSASSADDNERLEDANQQMEAYISQMREKFLWYVARKYEGYVGLDTTYQILRNDRELLSIRFETTLNVGGSGQYSRYITLNKRTGSVLELADLFRPDSDYIGVISREILRQMKEQVEAGEADYFIPGGIWSEDECFKEIGADQNFYLDDQDRLVIVFDEYEVAPGSMGIPEFIIPTEILCEILQQPSLIG